MQCLREKGIYSAKCSAKSVGYNEPKTPEAKFLLLTIEADAAGDHRAGHRAEVIVHVQNIR